MRVRKLNIASVSIFNKEGALLLQKRASHDDSFPAHWDVSAGGNIDEGEAPEDAAIREAVEELGATLEKVKLVAHRSISFPSWGDDTVENQLSWYLYHATHEGPFDIDRNEVEEVQFCSLKKVQEMIDGGESFHPKFLKMWNEGLMNIDTMGV